MHFIVEDDVMSGKRISREKKTIARMIALYENRCPHAIKEEGHYSALKAYADKRLDKCVFGEEKPACKQCPVLFRSALLSARPTGRDEAGDALGRATYVMAPSDSDHPSSDRRSPSGSGITRKVSAQKITGSAPQWATNYAQGDVAGMTG